MTHIMNHRPLGKAGGSSQTSLSHNVLFQKKSLNRDMRKKELMKITIENQAILKRLQDK